MTARSDGRVNEALNDGISGLARGLAVIESFDLEHPRLTVTEAARRTGLVPAVTRRCMRTLEQLGYLSFDGKHYAPTPRFARLATVYTDVDPLPTLATPLLAELRDELDESASLAVLDGDAALFIARAAARHFVTTGLRIGDRLPADRTAIGRVLLAGLPDAQQAALPSELREAIHQAAADGYSLIEDEIETGVRAVAVPVVDGSGRLVAAMSATAIAGRVSTADLRERFLPALQRQAAQLSRML